MAFLEHIFSSDFRLISNFKTVFYFKCLPVFCLFLVQNRVRHGDVTTRDGTTLSRRISKLHEDWIEKISLSHLYKTQNKKEKTPNLKTSKYDSTVKIVEFDIFFANIYIRNGINSNNNKKKQHFHFYIDPDYKWLPKNEWTQAIWMCSK